MLLDELKEFVEAKKREYEYKVKNIKDRHTERSDAVIRANISSDWGVWDDEAELSAIDSCRDISLERAKEEFNRELEDALKTLINEHGKKEVTDILERSGLLDDIRICGLDALELCIEGAVAAAGIAADCDSDVEY